MNDMTAIITPKSDQINADDLIAGPITITIRDVKIAAGTEQPVSIIFDGSDKVFRPCKSMSRVLVAAWGPDARQYVGRSVTLYRDAKVKWGGMEVGGIRISHLTDIEREMVMALTATKGKRTPYTVKPLTAPQPVQQEQGFTLDDARGAIIAAASMADLERVWKSRAMAPFRDELKDDLATRKADFDKPAAVEAADETDPFGDDE